MSPEKLSWVIALLTELKDNPGSELQVSTIGASESHPEVVWKKCYDLPKFVFPQSCYRVVKPKKYRLYRATIARAVVRCITTLDHPEAIADVQHDVDSGHMVWLTDWLPLPEQK